MRKKHEVYFFLLVGIDKTKYITSKKKKLYIKYIIKITHVQNNILFR